MRPQSKPVCSNARSVKMGPSRNRSAKTLPCSLFIEQRDGGTAWRVYQTIIGSGSDRLVIAGRASNSGSRNRFATREAAAEAAEKAAWEVIRTTFPGVCTSDMAWKVIAEPVGGFIEASMAGITT